MFTMQTESVIFGDYLNSYLLRREVLLMSTTLIRKASFLAKYPNIRLPFWISDFFERTDF